ncbi:hypothetical protein, partial [Rhodosalinus sp. 5P4]|uniref:hypothetical protein n=1 Tax=Rhodosalinus sp. 5P4 TaxID=3239196 RepID=UPI003524FD3F
LPMFPTPRPRAAGEGVFTDHNTPPQEENPAPREIFDISDFSYLSACCHPTTAAGLLDAGS